VLHHLADWQMGIVELLYLNDVPNRLWDGRMFELFPDCCVIGLVEFSELVGLRPVGAYAPEGDSDDKGESAFLPR